MMEDFPSGHRLTSFVISLAQPTVYFSLIAPRKVLAHLLTIRLGFFGWKIEPLIIVTAGARAATHIPSMDSILKTFKISKTSTKNTFKEINVIAIQYAKTICQT